MLSITVLGVSETSSPGDVVKMHNLSQQGPRGCISHWQPGAAAAGPGAAFGVAGTTFSLLLMPDPLKSQKGEVSAFKMGSQ